MTDQEVINAFHIMWDNFPEPVTITQRSREIIAVNKKAAELGLTAGQGLWLLDTYYGTSGMDSPLQRRPGGRISGTETVTVKMWPDKSMDLSGFFLRWAGNNFCSVER